MRASSASFIGKALRRRDPFPDRDRGLASLARRGIELRPRLTAAEGDTAVFADGERRKVAAVVWAVGYRDRTDWIEIPGALGDDGRLLHDAGVSPVPGIAYVGRPWQRVTARRRWSWGGRGCAAHRRVHQTRGRASSDRCCRAATGGGAALMARK